LLAETFPAILPTLTNQAQLEVMSLYQLAGERRSFHQNAPYRNPHHSASSVAIIGGGSSPRLGEISLAHRGVLFLDEIAEFTKKTIDMLSVLKSVFVKFLKVILMTLGSDPHSSYVTSFQPVKVLNTYVFEMY
jgi:hypothetical protein